MKLLDVQSGRNVNNASAQWRGLSDAGGLGTLTVWHFMLHFKTRIIPGHINLSLQLNLCITKSRTNFSKIILCSSEVWTLGSNGAEKHQVLFLFSHGMCIFEAVKRVEPA